MAEVKVTRFEIYPPDNPTGWVVGFTVVCSNGRSFYVDTTVNYDEAKTDEDAINAAIEKLKDVIKSRSVELENRSPVIGKSISF